jgi:hypothetical protein
VDWDEYERREWAQYERRRWVEQERRRAAWEQEQQAHAAQQARTDRFWKAAIAMLSAGLSGYFWML